MHILNVIKYIISYYNIQTWTPTPTGKCLFKQRIRYLEGQKNGEYIYIDGVTFILTPHQKPLQKYSKR